MLRLSALLSALLWATTAWADPIEQGLATAGKATDKIIADNGTIGSVLILVALASITLHALLIWAIISLYKANQNVQDKRAVEAAESTKQVTTTAVAGANAIIQSSEKLASMDSRLTALEVRLAPLTADNQRIIANQDKILERLPRGA